MTVAVHWLCTHAVNAVIERTQFLRLEMMLCCWAQFLTFCQRLKCRQAFLLDCLPNHTSSHPRRPKSSTQFSFCDNLYAFPHERLQPSGQTTNLTTCRHLVRSWEEWTHYLLCNCFLSACLCPLPPIFIGITGLILCGVIVFSFFLVLTDSSSALWARGGTGDWWLATSQPELILSPCQLQHQHCFIYKRLCCLLHLEVQIV
jgi:hypothetical protein